MSRKPDVDQLLRAAQQQHQDLRAHYDEALRDRSLDLRVQVKNLMENLRSALDYMAHDIYESCCRPARHASGRQDPSRVYFPYGRTEADFRAAAGSSLPGLATEAPDVYELLLSLQPFRSKEHWVCDLCSILNESKHDKLTPQERSESETYSVESQFGCVAIPVNNPNIRVTSLPGAVRIFGVPAQFTPDGIKTAPSDGLRHKRTTWVAFTFTGTQVNVLGLLDKAVVGVSTLAERLYHHI